MKAKAKPGRIGTMIARLNHKGTNWTTKGNWMNEGVMFSMLNRWGLSIPRDRRVLWFSLYDRDGDDRTELSVRTCGSAHPVVMYDGVEVFDRKSCDDRLAKYIGKSVYAEVEYLVLNKERTMITRIEKVSEDA
jgi:hypothetical protein